MASATEKSLIFPVIRLICRVVLTYFPALADKFRHRPFQKVGQIGFIQRDVLVGHYLRRHHPLQRSSTGLGLNFNHFLNTAAGNTATHTRKPVNWLMFVDDLLIYAPYSDISLGQAILQEVLDSI